MIDINERKQLHTERLKDNRIQYILEIMARYNITTEELASYQFESNQQKLAKIKLVQANKVRHAENLKKAREAREAKRNGKQAES